MRKIVLPVAGAMLVAMMPAAAAAQNAAPTSAADPAELAEARAIMEIAFPAAEQEETFGTMVGQLLQQFRQTIPDDVVTDAGLKAIMERHLDGLPARLMPTMKAHLPRIVDATAVAYTDEFSLEELKEIHAFARTDAGRHYLSQSAKLVGHPAVAAANTAYMGDLQRLQKGISDEFMQEVVGYLEEHPEVAETLKSGRSS